MVAESALTLAGFIGLASLGLGAIGLAINAMTKGSELRDRVTTLEIELREHLKNGTRHERR
jgi:hypothetical protein